MENDSKNLIYGLFCPLTGEIHYVGKTRVGMKRPLTHLNNSHSDKINEWVDGLRKFGLSPEINILETCEDDSELIEKEKYWVYKFVGKGAQLLNIPLIKAANVLHKTKLNLLTIPEEEEVELQLNGMESVSEFVKTKRKECKITQKDFADKAGVGLRFLRELEQGEKTTLRLDKVIQVLKMFNATLVPFTPEPLR